MYGKETERRTLEHGKHEPIMIEEKNQTNGTVLRRYTRGKMLGKGGFAKCYELLPHDNNKKYAVKVVEKASLTRSKAKEKLASEIKIHKALKSDYVVDFHHYFEDSASVYIILELCTNQTLNELVRRRKRITQIQAKYYLRQIALGIKDIHRQKIIHRDLKLGNLFLTEKLEIRIGDFGLAAKLNLEGERRKTMCGTPNYIAPEILENISGHSYEVDIWSLGVIAYAFVVGRPPFQTNDVKMTYSKIKACNYSFPESVPLSPQIKKFISKMLVRDPSRRSTIDEILQDDFFTSCSIPTSLPMSLLACPPNSAFVKKYSEQTKPTVEFTHQTSREQISRKQTRETLNTERGDLLRQRSKDRADSIGGRVLVRANSIDRVDKRNNVVQRASSSAAIIVPKKHSVIQMRHPEPQIQIEQHLQGPQVWVTYSEQNPKFGICYILNSHAIGMKFNDSTYLISNSTFTKIKYFPNYKQLSNGQIYDIISTPESLAKKMKIITYYRKQLLKRKDEEQNTLCNQQLIKREKLRFRETQDTAMKMFVIKHYKTSKVNIFWFNNQYYQVVFKDCTQLQILRDTIVYVNKFGERKPFMKSSIESQAQEIKKRFNHTEGLIKKIRQSGTRNSGQENINRENQPHTMVRSSSVSKVEKPKYALKGSASMCRLASYKLIK